ncbi:MAG: hypothetical protein P8106_05480, partial [Gammaproteobacteria bacterium]
MTAGLRAGLAVRCVLGRRLLALRVLSFARSLRAFGISPALVVAVAFLAAGLGLARLPGFPRASVRLVARLLAAVAVALFGLVVALLGGRLVLPFATVTALAPLFRLLAAGAVSLFGLIVALLGRLRALLFAIAGALVLPLFVLALFTGLRAWRVAAGVCLVGRLAGVRARTLRAVFAVFLRRRRVRAVAALALCAVLLAAGVLPGGLTLTAARAVVLFPLARLVARLRVLLLLLFTAAARLGLLGGLGRLAGRLALLFAVPRLLLFGRLAAGLLLLAFRLLTGL